MSDLISRNKVINILEKEKSLSCGYNSDITIFSIEKGIRELPTAYSVDRVVTELNELDVKAIKRYKGGIFGNYEGTDYYIEKSKAIEIVKQGVVSDDVCEWRKHSICGFYSEHEGAVRIINIADGYKYCPYCGKKIKVVK